MPRTGRRSTVVVALALSVAACERSQDAAPIDTSSALPQPAIDTVVDTAASSGWRADAGPVLLVPGDAAAAAIVIAPTASFDPAALAGAELTLFARHGVAGRAVAGRISSGSSGECEAATVQLRAAGGAPPGAWLVGFASPAVAAVALDSIEALAGPDSARLVADVVRLASTIPDSAEVFRGLPFSVRSVRRFTATPGTSALVAELVRRISTEANPREERTLVIAERASGAERHSLAYFERSAGAEESVVAPDVLAVIRFGTPPVLAMVISRDDGEGVRYALVEREAPARWVVRWVSGPPDC